MVCTYCGGSQFGPWGKCVGCGATSDEANKPIKKPAYDDTPGFPYNGHWVVASYLDDFGDARVFRFYLGPQLMATVLVERSLLMELFGSPQLQAYQSHDLIMKFVWELYLVAVGDQKEYVLDWVKRNSFIQSARYVITRAPDDNRQYAFGEKVLGLNDLVALANQVRG